MAALAFFGSLKARFTVGKKTQTQIEKKTAAPDTTQGVLYRPQRRTRASPSFFFYATMGEKAEALFIETSADSFHHPDILRLRNSLRFEIPLKFIQHLRTLSPIVDDFLCSRQSLQVVLYRPVYVPVLKTIYKIILPKNTLPRQVFAPEVPIAVVECLRALSPLTAPANGLQVVLYQPIFRPIDNHTEPDAPAPPPATPAPRALEITDFDIFEQVGRGGFGTVFRAEHRATKTPVAVKRIEKCKEVREEDIVHELELMKMVSGIPGVVGLLGAFHDSHYYYIVMPYYGGGDLFQLRKKRGKLSLEAIQYYAARILVALQKIHERGICHRDMKLQNVFLDANLEAFVGDFGLSALAGAVPFGTGADKGRVCGTPQFIAPEMWKSKPYGAPLDVWEYGATMFALYMGRPIWTWDELGGMSYLGMWKTMGGNVDEFLGDEAKLVPLQFRNFLKKIMDSPQDKRPSFEELKDDPFFEDYDWAAIEAGKVRVPELSPFRRLKRKAAPAIPVQAMAAQPSISFLTVECGTPYDLGEDPLPVFNYVSEALGGCAPASGVPLVTPPEWFYKPWINDTAAMVPSSSSWSSDSSGFSSARASLAPSAFSGPAANTDTSAAPSPVAACPDLLSGSTVATAGSSPALCSPAPSCFGTTSGTTGSPALSAFSSHPSDGSDTSAHPTPELCSINKSITPNDDDDASSAHEQPAGEMYDSGLYGIFGVAPQDSSSSTTNSSSLSSSAALSAFSGSPLNSETSACSSPAPSCLNTPSCASSDDAPISISITQRDMTDDGTPAALTRPTSVERHVPDCPGAAAARGERGSLVGGSPEVSGQDDASGEWWRRMSHCQDGEATRLKMWFGALKRVLLRFLFGSYAAFD